MPSATHFMSFPPPPRTTLCMIPHQDIALKEALAAGMLLFWPSKQACWCFPPISPPPATKTQVNFYVIRLFSLPNGIQAKTFVTFQRKIISKLKKESPSLSKSAICSIIHSETEITAFCPQPEIWYSLATTLGHFYGTRRHVKFTVLQWPFLLLNCFIIVTDTDKGRCKNVKEVHFLEG